MLISVKSLLKFSIHPDFSLGLSESTASLCCTDCIQQSQQQQQHFSQGFLTHLLRRNILCPLQMHLMGTEGHSHWPVQGVFENFSTLCLQVPWWRERRVLSPDTSVVLPVTEKPGHAARGHPQSHLQGTFKFISTTSSIKRAFRSLTWGCSTSGSRLSFKYHHSFVI